MKKIEDYYWETEGQEGKVVVGILSKFFPNPDGYKGQTGRMTYGIENGRLSTQAKANRTLATIDDLVKLACAGFDLREPWEIPPEGYRLVTDEEMEEFTKPMCAKYSPNSRGCGEGIWANCMYTKSGWMSYNAYAVPLSYEFKKPVKKMTVAEIAEQLGYDVEIVKEA